VLLIQNQVERVHYFSVAITSCGFGGPRGKPVRYSTTLPLGYLLTIKKRILSDKFFPAVTSSCRSSRLPHGFHLIRPANTDVCRATASTSIEWTRRSSVATSPCVIFRALCFFHSRVTSGPQYFKLTIRTSRPWMM
jgi:hypothetical protein